MVLRRVRLKTIFFDIAPFPIFLVQFRLNNWFLERRIELYNYILLLLWNLLNIESISFYFLSPHSHITNIYMVYHTTCDRIHNYLFGTASVICFISFIIFWLCEQSSDSYDNEFRITTYELMLIIKRGAEISWKFIILISDKLRVNILNQKIRSKFYNSFKYC